MNKSGCIIKKMDYTNYWFTVKLVFKLLFDNNLKLITKVIKNEDNVCLKLLCINFQNSFDIFYTINSITW